MWGVYHDSSEENVGENVGDGKCGSGRWGGKCGEMWECSNKMNVVGYFRICLNASTSRLHLKPVCLHSE